MILRQPVKRKGRAVSDHPVAFVHRERRMPQPQVATSGSLVRRSAQVALASSTPLDAALLSLARILGAIATAKAAVHQGARHAA